MKNLEKTSPFQNLENYDCISTLRRNISKIYLSSQKWVKKAGKQYDSWKICEAEGKASNNIGVVQNHGCGWILRSVELERENGHQSMGDFAVYIIGRFLLL